MANYENGVSTRQAIVKACKQLFFDKGYHETSYSDICKAANVNRSTIYYHFRDKEDMLYEVVWEFTTDCKRIVERYCDRPEYHYILSMYMLWNHTKYDEKARKFHLSICDDYPIYTGKKDFSHYYYVLIDRMWGFLVDKQQLSDLAIASVYGYIICCMRLMCEHPERYDIMEMFEHCVNSSISIWGVPREKMDDIWKDIKHYISLIPEEEMVLRL